MSIPQRLFALATIMMVAALLAMSWVTTALAQASSDADGLDGDELGLPIVLGVGVVAYLGWMALRRRSRKSPN
jgi:hypothetical protein